MRIKRTAIADPGVQCSVFRVQSLKTEHLKLNTTLQVRTCERCGETFGEELPHCPSCPQGDVEQGIFRTKASDAIHLAQLVGDRGVTRCGFVFHRGDERFGWGVWSEEFCEFLEEEFGIFVQLCARCPDCRPPKGWRE